ncbi:MAG: hypothetical protein LBL90_03840 [Prevotellaceae bacterium]|jgi:hypothetical protein|nr:hypothetical protein [Prevotellaceae bacterium]
MKQIITFTFVILLFLGLTAQAQHHDSVSSFIPDKTDAKIKNAFVQASLFFPIGTSGRASPNYHYNLSLNIAEGVTGGIRGVELNGLTGISHYINGVQINGLGAANGEVKGLQLSGLISGTSHLSGLQISGLVGLANNVRGIQLNGVLGLANKLEGLQVAGFVNITKSVQGMQLAGALNRTKSLRGLQIAIVNVIDTVSSGIPLGIVNIVQKGGYSQWELYTSDIVNIGVGYKLGIRKFYSIYSVGFNFIEDRLFSAGFGFGSNWVISKNKKYEFQPELLNYFYFPTDFKTIRFTSATQLKLGFVRNFGKVGVYLAPSVYVSIMDKKDGIYDYKISPVRAVHKRESSDNKLSIGIGYTVGISLQ